MWPVVIDNKREVLAMTEYVYNKIAATPAINPTTNPSGLVIPVANAAFEVVVTVLDVAGEVLVEDLVEVVEDVVADVSLVVDADVVVDVVLYDEMLTVL